MTTKTLGIATPHPPTTPAVRGLTAPILRLGGAETPPNRRPCVTNKPNLPGPKITLTLDCTVPYTKNTLRPGLKKQTQSNPIVSRQSQPTAASPPKTGPSSWSQNKPNRRRRPERRSGAPDRSRTDLPLALSSSAPNKPNFQQAIFMLNPSANCGYGKSGRMAWPTKQTQSNPIRPEPWTTHAERPMRGPAIPRLWAGEPAPHCVWTIRQGFVAAQQRFRRTVQEIGTNALTGGGRLLQCDVSNPQTKRVRI
jgi:hypothetical protein